MRERESNGRAPKLFNAFGNLDAITPHYRLLNGMGSLKQEFQIFMDFIGLLQMHMFCGTIISYKIYVEKVSK